MAFVKVLLDFVVVFVVDVFKFGVILLANLALQVRTHPQVDPEGVAVIESTLAEIAIGMIEDYLVALLVVLSFLQVRSKLAFGVEVLVGQEALAVLEADVTR